MGVLGRIVGILMGGVALSSFLLFVMRLPAVWSPGYNDSLAVRGAVSIEGEPQPRPVHDPFPSMGLSVADPVSHRERFPRICGLVCLDGTPSHTCMTPPHVTYEIHEVAGRR